jgi:Chitin synthase export chaperone
MNPVWLGLAGLFFAVAQIFQFLASSHICDGTSGKINGGLFSVLFTLISVVFTYFFWSSITEDDFPEAGYA